jgi:hypothetical protein
MSYAFHGTLIRHHLYEYEAISHTSKDEPYFHDLGVTIDAGLDWRMDSLTTYTHELQLQRHRESPL